MEQMIIYNGALIAEKDFANLASNRAFLYGDGVFETIKVISGKPIFLSAHLKRMKAGAEAMLIEFPELLEKDNLENQIKTLIEHYGYEEGMRIRITLYRNTGGWFKPEVNTASYIINCSPLETNLYALNTEGLLIDMYPDMRKQHTKLSPFKTLNSQIYVMASVWAKKQGLDDALIQNDQLAIIEGSSSNLFIVSNGVLYTPAVTDGCLGGVMRMNIINLAIAHNYKVYECRLTPQNLLVADEIFLTNAISGLQWVSSYKTKRYFNTVTKKLTDLLNLNILNEELEMSLASFKQKKTANVKEQ